MSRSLGVAVVGAAMTCGLAACAGPSTGGLVTSTSARSVPTSVPPVPAASPCSTNELHGTQTTQGALGTEVGYIELTNSSSRACWMKGYAGFVPLGADGQHLPVRLVQREGLNCAPPEGFCTPPGMGAPMLVTLEPGDKAFFGFTYTAVAVTTPQGVVELCDEGVSTAVTPPGDSAPLVVAGAIDPCGPGYDVVISPIYAGGHPTQALSPNPTTTKPTTALPGVMAGCTAPAPEATLVSIRPSRITLACADDGQGVQDLSWTSWTSQGANATGEVWQNNCTPDCARGTILYYPASITLSEVTRLSIGPLFTALTASYEGIGPNGRRTQRFALPVPPARCHTSSLRASFGPVSTAVPGSSQDTVSLVFTNTSALTCSLYGFPGFTLVRSMSNETTTYSPVRQSALPGLVSLSPGASAHAAFTFGTGPDICDHGVAWVPTVVQTIPPDETAALTVPWTGGSVDNCQGGATRPATYIGAIVDGPAT